MIMGNRLLFEIRFLCPDGHVSLGIRSDRQSISSVVSPPGVRINPTGPFLIDSDEDRSVGSSAEDLPRLFIPYNSTAGGSLRIPIRRDGALVLVLRGLVREDAEQRLEFLQVKKRLATPIRMPV